MTTNNTYQASEFKCVCGRISQTKVLHERHLQNCQGYQSTTEQPVEEDIVSQLLDNNGEEPDPRNVKVGYTPVVEEASPFIFTPTGEKLVQEMIACAKAGLHVLLIGPSGNGKSAAAREVSRRMARAYLSINAHPGMDTGLLIGQMLPRALPSGGITLEWMDGILTQAVRMGRTFFFEEITRAPQESVSRLFGLLDKGFSYYDLPEKGDEDIAIHPDFWMIGTANPAGQGYQTSRLDAALESRFGAIFEINEPLADEKAILHRILPAEKYRMRGLAIADKLYRFALDTRRNPDDPKMQNAAVNTRDLISTAELIVAGVGDPERAIELAIISKKPQCADSMRLLAKTRMHATTLEDPAETPVTDASAEHRNNG